MHLWEESCDLQQHPPLPPSQVSSRAGPPEAGESFEELASPLQCHWLHPRVGWGSVGVVAQPQGEGLVHAQEEEGVQSFCVPTVIPLVVQMDDRQPILVGA